MRRRRVRRRPRPSTSASRRASARRCTKEAPFRGIVLNINFPTCTAGAVPRREGRARRPGAAVHRLRTLQGSSMGVDTWKPTIGTGNPFVCRLHLDGRGRRQPTLEAFNAGFATAPPLDPERNSTGRKVKDFDSPRSCSDRREGGAPARPPAHLHDRVELGLAHRLHRRAATGAPAPSPSAPSRP